MEQITIIFVGALIQIALSMMWYMVGYNAREKKFQDFPIQFNSGDKKVLWVGRESGILKIRIFDKKEVELLTN
jgi:hypothetical protein